MVTKEPAPFIESLNNDIWISFISRYARKIYRPKHHRCPVLKTTEAKKWVKYEEKLKKTYRVVSD